VKIFIQRPEPRQNGQERSRRRRFDDEPLPLFSNNGVFTGQFELARNSNRLVAPIPEQFDVSFPTCDSVGVMSRYSALAFIPAAAEPRDRASRS
jgi:hypothetical protein